MGRTVGAQRRLPLRPHPVAGRGVLDRHPAAHGQRLAPPGPRLLLHPDRRDRPLPAHARPGGVLPDGLGRQRPADRAPGPAALRRPLRPVAALQAGLRAARVAVPAADRRLPAQLRRALQPAHHGGRAGLRSDLPAPGAVGRLVADLRHRRRAGPAGLPAGVPAPAGQGPGLPGRRPDPVGGRLPHRRRPGRAGGPRGRGHVLPPAVRRRASRSTPPGPSCWPPAWPWSSTPTTAASPPCRAPPCGPRCSGPRCRCWPTSWPTPARGPASPCSAPSATRPTWSGGASWACPCGRCWTRTAPSGRSPGARPGSAAPTRRPPSGPTTSWPACPSTGPGSGRRPCCARPAPWPRPRPASPRRSSSTSTAASRWRS